MLIQCKYVYELAEVQCNVGQFFSERYLTKASDNCNRGLHFIKNVTNRFFSRAERAQDEQAKPQAEPSIMILSTSICEHHTSLYEQIRAL